MKKNNSLDRNIRQCLSYVLKNDGPFRWSVVVGFSKEEFLKHLEENFSEGMSFDNYGEWVISFHIPKRLYKFTSINDENFKRFWSLKNIFPRWLKDAQQQKKIIKKAEVEKYGLWDILPVGNFSEYLV
jgi:hypothetical protein